MYKLRSSNFYLNDIDSSHIIHCNTYPGHWVGGGSPLVGRGSPLVGRGRGTTRVFCCHVPSNWIKLKNGENVANDS